jgi:hypothetical protein
MLSLPSNLMIRRGMIPLSEGLRLHSINNRALGLFLRVSGFVQPANEADAGKLSRSFLLRQQRGLSQR